MIGNKARCAVNHAPGYVPGECSGGIHPYRSLTSTAEWWLCDADAESAPKRGIPITAIDEDATLTPAAPNTRRGLFVELIAVMTDADVLLYGYERAAAERLSDHRPRGLTPAS